MDEDNRIQTEAVNDGVGPLGTQPLQKESGNDVSKNAESSQQSVQNADQSLRTSEQTGDDREQDEPNYYYEIMSNRSLTAMFRFFVLGSLIIILYTFIFGLLTATKYKDDPLILLESNWIYYASMSASLAACVILIYSSICYGIIVIFVAKAKTRLKGLIQICVFCSLIAGTMGSMPIGRIADAVGARKVVLGNWYIMYSVITARVAVSYFYFHLLTVIDYASFVYLPKPQKVWLLSWISDDMYLFLDKLAFAIMQCAIILPLQIVFKVTTGVFAWTSWVVMVRAAAAGNSIPAVDIVVVVITSILDLTGLVLFVIKLRLRSKELFHLPFYEHAKTVLYLKLQYVFTAGLWLIGLFFCLLYLQIVCPLELLYFNQGGHVYSAELTPSLAVYYLVYLWILCLAILFLPPQYPGFRGMYLFHRSEQIENITNQRATFSQSFYTIAGQRRMMAPRTLYFDCMELAFNFSKLAYGPPYNHFELVSVGSSEIVALASSLQSEQRGKCKTERQESDPSDVEEQRFLLAGKALRDYIEKVEGFDFVADISHEQYDSRAVVFHGNDLIVVCFRGTTSSTNVKADLNATLVEICKGWDDFSSPRIEAKNRQEPIPSQLARNAETESSEAATLQKFESFRPQQLEGLTAFKERLLDLLNSYLESEGDPGNTQWKESTNMSQTDFNQVVHDIQSELMLIHTGFLKAYLSIRDRLIDQLVALYAENRFHGHPKPIMITGHSLGGAMSCICAIDLAVNCRVPIHHIYTVSFGAPKVGTRPFANLVKLLSLNLFRVVSAGDVITRIPQGNLRGWFYVRYSQCGHLVLLDRYGNMLLSPTSIERFFLHRSSLGLAEHRLREYAQRCIKFALSINREFSVWTQTFIDILDVPTSPKQSDLGESDIFLELAYRESRGLSCL